jgi:hypothetical protein
MHRRAAQKIPFLLNDAIISIVAPRFFVVILICFVSNLSVLSPIVNRHCAITINVLLPLDMYSSQVGTSDAYWTMTDEGAASCPALEAVSETEICAPHQASDYARKCSVKLWFARTVHGFIVDLSIMEMCPVSVCIDGISLY